MEGEWEESGRNIGTAINCEDRSGTLSPYSLTWSTELSVTVEGSLTRSVRVAGGFYLDR